MTSGLVELDDAVIEVLDEGQGEPVVFIQTALAVDELLPVAEHPAVRGHRRVVHVRRRGYGGSSAPRPSPSVAADAADVLGAVRALGLDVVHLVGSSYSAAVALEAARHAPRVVRTLTLVEPPPADVPLAVDFRDAARRLLNLAQEDGPMAAVDALMNALDGPDWRTLAEARQPGEFARLERDAAAFVGSDIPALLEWQFDGAACRRVCSPTLLIGGAVTDPWFAQMRATLMARLPDVCEVVVPDAGHLVAVTHPGLVAPAIAAFAADHPVSP